MASRAKQIYQHLAAPQSIMSQSLDPWTSVPQAPPDSIFKLTAAYKTDGHPQKVNLGVGAYRDDNGKPWVLPVVQKVNEILLKDTTLDHEYLPITGLPEFTSAAAQLLFSSNSAVLKENRIASVQTISGTGANHLGALFLAKFYPWNGPKQVFISNPTWANHKAILKNVGIEPVDYPYYDPKTIGLDFTGLLGSLSNAPDRSVFLLHACAHNPTGVDPTNEQWEKIADVILQKGHFAFFDCAYQGFASGDLDRDASAVRYFAQRGVPLFVCQSFAKNAGLYGERVGALHVIGATPDAAARVKSQLSVLQRSEISNPPTYGARIMALILNDSGLFEEWKRDIKTMADRIINMRKELYRLLTEELKTPGKWDHIVNQIGMFSFTGLNRTQSRALIEKAHIYLTENGRISMAGLNSKNIRYFAESLNETDKVCVTWESEESNHYVIAKLRIRNDEEDPICSVLFVPYLYLLSLLLLAVVDSLASTRLAPSFFFRAPTPTPHIYVSSCRPAMSWINTVWNFPDPQLTVHNSDASNLTRNNDRHSTFDFDIVHAQPPSPVPHPDQSSPPPSTEQPTSLNNTIPSLELPPRPSSPATSSVILAPSVETVDNRHYLLVSSDYNERAPPPSMAEQSSLSGTGRTPPPAPSSPPLSSSPGLRIDVAAANDPTMDHEMVDASFIAGAVQPDNFDDLCFDDEGLTVVEKVFLFGRSASSFHRVFISRSLLSFLPDVSACEAVEYIIPLLNCLAMDEDEAVKEALVEDLVSAIRWFLTHCQLVDHEVPEGLQHCQVPLLSVQSFTPLLGTLLLNPNANVNAPARHCVIDLLARTRCAETDEEGLFSPEGRKLFEHELVQHVIIGMAHLDSDSPAEGTTGIDLLQHESTVADREDTSYSSVTESEKLRSPPPSAADDELLLSTLTSSVPALATTQFLAQEESSLPTVAAIAASIQRPPSPLPTSHPMVPVSEYEPDFAHIISQAASDESLNLDICQDRGSPMTGVTSLPAWSAEPIQNLQKEATIMERAMQDVPHSQIQAPVPEHIYQASASDSVGQIEQSEADRGDGGSEFNEEHVAIGKLASMSLIAAVTASGHLDEGYQSAFVSEIQRAGRDSVYWVRREATFALGALAKVVPDELLYTSLVPLFDYFCEDSVWNVRQSVLFALPAILSRMPPGSRRSLALQTIQKLAADPSPQVRTGVLEILGEVIFLFHEDEKGPPDEIVQLFIGEEGRDWHDPDSSALEIGSQPRTLWENTAFHSRFSSNGGALGLAAPPTTISSTQSPLHNTPDSDPARSLICAFNLPAVALTLGIARWHELRGLYTFLARTGPPKVRQTLAASIGEVARIIGPENARRDLLYRWWDFGRGRDPLVQTKALEALEVFLQVLSPTDRSRVIGTLEEIWDNHLKGWREREVLARSLDRLAPLFLDDGEALKNLLRRALRDSAAAVRNAAIEIFPHIYGYILSRPVALKLVVEEISSLAYDESFKKRLTYVECSRSLIASSPNYERFMDENFWHSVVVLSSDKIADVRIGLARLMSIVCDKILAKQRMLPGDVLNVIRKLSEDTITDVRAFVSHLLPPDLRPPTELAYGYATENTPAMATFSRPPPRRERKTLVSDMNDLMISSPFRDNEQYHQPMDQVGG